MDEYMMKETIFVFLHGPAAYPEGTWEPILLEALKAGGFDGGSLTFTERLYHTRAIGSGDGRIGCHLDSKHLLFGVMVVSEADPNKRDLEAESWLDDVALQISGLRIGCMVRKERTSEEARAHFREIAEILNAGGTVDSHGEEREVIARDPKTNSEYESMRQNPPDGFESFENFFARAQEMLAELIQTSKPLEPILLTEESDWFIQSMPPGLHDKHLRDKMRLEDSSGIHRTCGGTMQFIVTTETRITAVCDKCCLRIPMPILTVSTLGQLRDRGERIVL